MPSPKNETNNQEYPPLPEFEADFVHNPVYIAVTSKTIKTAEKAYSFARFLSIVLFFVGIALLITSITLSIFKSETVLTIFFGGLGATSIISLLLYRPIERIQSGVDSLIKSQIACISFAAQYDIIMRTLYNSTNQSYENRLKLAQYMRELTTQLIADLDGRLNVHQAQEKVSNQKSG